MKRIISLIMSVLMIATMFCSFAVSSTAADQKPFHVTVVAGEVAADGTFDVEIWAKDNTPYGLHNFGFYVKWDEAKLEPVTTTIENKYAAFLEISPALAFIENFNSYKDYTGSTAAYVGQYGLLKSGRVTLGKYATGQAPCNWIGVSHSGDAAYYCGFFWDYDIIEEVCGAGTADELGIDREKGIKIADATFKVKDGATGEATIWAETENGYILETKDDYVNFISHKAQDGLSCTPAAIDCGSDEPETPALPEGITLDVQAGVQARIDTYDGNQTGLRFTTIATATDWSMIDEMGTAIVIAGTTPGVDTTLAVPARVDWDGDFLHNFTKNEEGLRDFEDGIVSDKAAITYTGVISNIKEANKDVDFQAYAYVIVDGKTYYSTTSATGNYNDIFGAAQDDPTIA